VETVDTAEIWFFSSLKPYKGIFYFDFFTVLLFNEKTCMLYSALDNKLTKHVMEEAVRNILAKRRRTGRRTSLSQR
jgi:hypothetical protein